MSNFVCVEAGCRGCFSCAYDKYHVECRAALARAQQERNEYQERVHTLTEQARMMTSAASSAAASTVTAIARIEEMEKVIKAAENWAQGGPHGDLVEAVRMWQKYKGSWS